MMPRTKQCQVLIRVNPPPDSHLRHTWIEAFQELDVDTVLQGELDDRVVRLEWYRQVAFRGVTAIRVSEVTVVRTRSLSATLELLEIGMPRILSTPFMFWIVLGVAMHNVLGMRRYSLFQSHHSRTPRVCMDSITSELPLQLQEVLVQLVRSLF